jgi:acyl-coenzyme A thioesterase PaaI-like protein
MAGSEKDPFDHVGHLVRELVRHLAVTNLTPADADALAQAVEPIVARFDALPPRGARSRTPPSPSDFHDVFAGDPVMGRRNPIAPPVEVEVDGKTVRGRTNLPRQYEGPPGHVHGAIIAGIFDMMLGVANIVSANPGMTGTLEIRYINPTPLNTDLVFEAKTTGAEGRKIFAVGTCHAGDRLTAEAKGIFVLPSIERAKEYFGHTWGA